MLLESGAPDTLVALARAGYGIAVVPSNAQIPRGGVRALPIVQHGVVLGTWASIAWAPRRVHAPYAAHFVEELVMYSRRAFPGRDLARHPPPLPRPTAPAPAG